jgi:Putative transposase/Transposase zinc-binding domain
MALVTLHTIFHDAFPADEQRHAWPAHVRRAAHAIMQCRTAALGGHGQACPDGHRARIWYHACRHRSCPQGASLQTERWLALQQARLLACDHSQVIFTLPHELNPLWLANVPGMTTLLLQAVRDTLGTVWAAPKYLGAQPGIMAALHTWSQPLMLHPHLHCLVTGGGLTPAGQWVAVRHGFLLPARVVMAVLRGQMVAAIRQTFVRGALALPAPMRPQQGLNLLNRLGHPTQTTWQVRIMERDRHGAGVGTSLARYLRGGPIKNGRLGAYDGACVTFTSRTRQEEAAAGPASPHQRTLPVAALLQRWLLHVPGPQTRGVRSYGRYHPSHAAALAVCRAARGQPPLEAPAALDWQTVCAPRGDAHPERGPTCGQRLVCTGVIPRGGAPPRISSEECAA